MIDKKPTHIAGTFLIQVDAAFLNGAGLGEGEDRNVTIPKTFRDGKNEVPYVSSQAWKRWLRNTLIEEKGWPPSELKAIGWNPKGNVSKIAAELNPVDFIEDDIFGYMRAEKGQGQRASTEDETTEQEEEAAKGRTKSIIRASPFMASLLISLRSTWWRGQDEGFVHLTKYDSFKLAEAEIERFLEAIGKTSNKKKSTWERLKEINDLADKAKPLVDKGDLHGLRKLLSENANGKVINFIENPCSPLPYTTRFYNAHLQGIFCLNYSRLGVYWNLGDRIELEEEKVRGLLKEEKIRDITNEEPYKTLSDNGKIGRIYRITEKVKPTPKERASALFAALAVLRGGAKQAQFGTDVSPKVLIVAGLTCGNPIFNHLFKDDPEGPILKTETFKEIVKDYADRIATPVFIGIRSGYLKNESEVRDLAGIYGIQQNDNVRVVTKKDVGAKKNGLEIVVEVLTPIEAARKIGENLT
jgi:CRISPR/Cas system-associated protein Cas7 (RAMP superfamily)